MLDNKLQGKYRGDMGRSLETTDPSLSNHPLPCGSSGILGAGARINLLIIRITTCNKERQWVKIARKQAVGTGFWSGCLRYVSTRPVTDPGRPFFQSFVCSGKYDDLMARLLFLRSTDGVVVVKQRGGPPPPRDTDRSLKSTVHR